MVTKYKSDLVQAVAEDIQVAPEVVRQVLASAMRVIVAWLGQGIRVTWTGLGVFDPRERISPLPGQPFAETTAARGRTRWILFRPSTYLRELLREHKEEEQ